MHPHSHFCAGAAALASYLAAPALADVQAAIYAAPDQWVYQVKHMPDFDQRRVPGQAPDGSFAIGLPNGGKMYCVPTSSMNMMTYLAAHGFPEIEPGPASNLEWQTQGRYNQISLDLVDMGILMETDWYNGTGGTGWYAGVTDWLDTYGALGKFTVTMYSLTSTFTPNLTSMGEVAISGSIISFAYGRYDNEGTLFGNVVIGERHGGHCITFSHGARIGNWQLLGVRDPGDGNDNLQTQSSFGNYYIDAIDLPTLICAGLDCSHDMTFLNYDPDKEIIGMIDGYMGIRPKAGYGFTPSNELYWIQPAWWGTQVEPIVQLEFPPEMVVQDLAVLPDLEGLLVLTKADGIPEGIWTTDVLNQDPVMVAQVPGALGMAMGRHRDLYVLTEFQLLYLRPELEEPVVATAPIPEPGAAVACDDATGDIIVLCPGDETLRFYKRNLPVGVPVDVQGMPAGMMLGAKPVMATDPPGVGANIWIASDLLPVVYGLRRGDPGYMEMVNLPAMHGAVALDVDDAGHLFVTTADGEHLELMRTATGGWQLVPPEQKSFPDAPEGLRLEVTRTRTNWDPAVHQDPGWSTNIDPALLEAGLFVPDCDADLNGDGQVDGADVGLLLGDWGERTLADLDQDGAVDGADLGLLLAAWGPCPE
jgi:hypothetical protein